MHQRKVELVSFPTSVNDQIFPSQISGNPQAQPWSDPLQWSRLSLVRLWPRLHRLRPLLLPWLQALLELLQPGAKVFQSPNLSLLRWRRARSRRCWFWVASSVTTPPSWLPCFQKSRIITLCNSRGDPSYIVIRVTNRCHFLLERS